jgi:hypothetical protein
MHCVRVAPSGGAPAWAPETDIAVGPKSAERPYLLLLTVMTETPAARLGLGRDPSGGHHRVHGRL